MALGKRDHELYEQADRARKQSEFEIAQRYAEALLRNNPHHKRGQELLRQIKVERAQSGLSMGERVNMSVKAFFKKLRGKHLDALDELELLYRRDPTKLGPALAFAKSCIRCEKYKEAVEPLEDAIKNNYKSREANELAVDVLRRLERFEDALKVLHRLREINPSKEEKYKHWMQDVSADQNRRQIEQERLVKARSDEERERREKEAKLAEKSRIQELIQECGANPDNDELKLELVDLLIETQNFANAVRVLEPLCTKLKQVPLWEKLALLLEQTQQWEKLGNLYKDLQRQPGVDPAKYQMPMVKARLALAEEKLAESPESTVMREHVVKLESQLREMLIHNVRVEKRENPGQLDLTLKLARLLRQDGRVDDAIREYQELAQNPSYAFIASHELGRCFLQKGMLSLGIERLEIALTKLPKTRETTPEPAKQILYTLGEYYLLKDQRDKGLDYWKRLYDADIGYRDIQNRYEKAYQDEDIGPSQDLDMK